MGHLLDVAAPKLNEPPPKDGATEKKFRSQMTSNEGFTTSTNLVELKVPSVELLTYNIKKMYNFSIFIKNAVEVTHLRQEPLRLALPIRPGRMKILTAESRRN